MRIKIEWVELDDHNLAHVTRHGVSAEEVLQVFANDPAISTNHRDRTGTHAATGYTDGGRRMRINFIYDARTRAARPISAWEVNR